MSYNYLFTNNAATTLASSFSAVATSLTVATGSGALFPFPFPATLPGDPDSVFAATLVRLSDGAVEIIIVTNRSGDAFNNIVRAQEGTTALAFSAGDKIELRITAAAFGSFANASGGVNTNITSTNALQDINGGGWGGFKNKIINGDFRISQRGTSWTSPVTNTYLLDRWMMVKGGTIVADVTQNADAPATFQNSLRFSITATDTTATAFGATIQRIEGYNARSLIGKTFTISFWVRSSKTGIHCVFVRNAASDRSYVMEYSVSIADTWEQKSVQVIDGLVTDGIWDWTTGIGLNVGFTYANLRPAFQSTAGSWQVGNMTSTSAQVNVADTINNIFAITGVQLEIGSVASPFEERHYSTELALCEPPVEFAANPMGFTRGVQAYSLNGGQLAGFRNRIINGSMQVWQRGTSFTNQNVTAGNIYCQDRWMGNRSSDVNGQSISRYSVTSTDRAVASLPMYGMKWQRVAGDTAVNQMTQFYALDTTESMPLAGQMVTLSAYIKAGANYSGSNTFVLQLSYGTGTDQREYLFTGRVAAATLSSQTPGATMARIQVTGAIPTTATQVGFRMTWVPTGTAGADDSVYVTGVQLEVGYIATPFEHRSYAEELALCECPSDTSALGFTRGLNAASINGGPLAGFRNRIINGGCQISQRGQYIFAANGTSYGGCDRFQTNLTGFTTVSAIALQSTFSMNGATHSHQIGNLTTTGSGSAAVFTRLESLNVRDLNSKTVTFSLWVYQATGAALNMQMVLRRAGSVDNFASPVLISAQTATSVPDSVATQLTYTVTLGASDATNGLQLELYIPTIGALTTKQIYTTQWQLEVGSVATPFEARPYGTELALCQRYYYRITPGNFVALATMGFANTTTTGTGLVKFPVSMRIAPTALEQTGAATDYGMGRYGAAGNTVCSAVPTFMSASTEMGYVQLTVAAGLTNNAVGLPYANSATAYLGFSAEL